MGELRMTICKLNEFGECNNEVAPSQRFVPKPREFCCEEHSNRYRYLKRRSNGLLEDRKEERRLRKVAPEEREEAAQGLAAIQASWSAGKFVRRI
jgi:hypothetical protein